MVGTPGRFACRAPNLGTALVPASLHFGSSGRSGVGSSVELVAMEVGVDAGGGRDGSMAQT